ncbi:MAG: non-ribosomal peptide synthetase [Acidimicrobiales bacterium]
MASRKPVDAPRDQAVLGSEDCDGPLAIGRGRLLPPTGHAPVHELVAEFARSNPTRTAVQTAAGAISYGALDAWAARIAAQLAVNGVRRGDRVGILAEPSTPMVAAVLGILRAGAAYVPVDQRQPQARIAEVLDNAHVAGVVVSRHVQDSLGVLGLPIVAVIDGFERGSTTEHSPADFPAVPVRSDDVAYIIYTSGSTGEPKGVVVEHRHLSASTLARRSVYGGTPVFLLVSPLASDSSVAGLWGTLTAGGCLVVATSDEVRDPTRLVELVERYRVTRLLCVPALYSLVLDAAERLGLWRLRSLETVTVAGELLHQELVERHFALHTGPVTLVNEYGPTEATVWASFLRLDAPAPVSIGTPVPGAWLYVLDDEGQLVPRGTEGELFIGGAGVARGYFRRPDATAQAFVDDPFASEPGARMYRTGDRARWNREGTLDFLGRLDHQVKIRGHRVELDAVEAALRAVRGVRDAVVVANSAGTDLVGFVVASCVISAETLRRHLSDRLPNVMVPALIRILDGFPITVSGKVDRNLLRISVDDSVARPDPTPAAAIDFDRDAAALVAAAWAEVLNLSEVPVDVNFFDLGGHSLAMFRLQDALECHTGTRPSIVALFRHTTVSTQAELLRIDRSAPVDSLEPRRQDSDARASAVLARRQRAEPEPAT